MGTRFEDINVGQTAKIVHKISADDIQKFVELSGDDNRLHVDADFAAETSFKKPVAHGMLGASFISTVIGTKLPGDGALWVSQSLEFLLPVRIGDEITVLAKVLKKHSRDQSIELKTDVFNQHKQIVTRGIAKVKIIATKIEGAEHELSKLPHSGKVALVVGATGGVGSATCRKLAEDGYDIAVHYNKGRGKARSLVKELSSIEDCRAYTFYSDILDIDSVNEMVLDVVLRLGGITVLVICVSHPLAAMDLSDLEWSDFEKHINIQVQGSFHLASSVVPIMKKNSYGKIIFINSMMLERPPLKFLPYITSKGALMGFARSLAVDLAAQGIRVNSVSPGMTDTSLIDNFPERAKLSTAAKTPLGCLAKPDDVADAVSYLASTRSDFLCGETIRVNGGQVMI